MPDGVGEGYAAMQQTPPMGPRAVFTGAESLAAVAAAAKLANEKAGLPECAQCKRHQATITAREADIGKLKHEAEGMRERLEEQAAVLDQRTTAADESRLMDRIRELQARDVVQRRDLDLTYLRLAKAWQQLAAAGISLEESGTVPPADAS